MLGRENRVWLILEKSIETRVSISGGSYPDITGESYDYDSLVPNHKNLAAGHIVIVRKNDSIVGIGMIKSIISKEGIKELKRCQKCDHTDIRERKYGELKWKCGRCREEFSNPVSDPRPVTNFHAIIDDFFSFKDNGIKLDVKVLKECALRGNGKAQNSIIELNPLNVRRVLIEFNFKQVDSYL